MGERLEMYTKKFYLLLEQFKKQYPLYKSSNSKEYKNIFLNTENNLNNLYKDLFLLENDILKNTNSIDKNLQKQDNEINEDKIKFIQLDKTYQILKDKTGASGPFRKQHSLIKKETIVYFTYHLLGIFGLFYLMYKL